MTEVGRVTKLNGSMSYCQVRGIDNTGGPLSPTLSPAAGEREKLPQFLVCCMTGTPQYSWLWTGCWCLTPGDHSPIALGFDEVERFQTRGLAPVIEGRESSRRN